MDFRGLEYRPFTNNDPQVPSINIYPQMQGCIHGALGMVREVAGGVADVLIHPAKGAVQGGLIGGLSGVLTGMQSLVRQARKGAATLRGKVRASTAGPMHPYYSSCYPGHSSSKGHSTECNGETTQTYGLYGGQCENFERQYGSTHVGKRLRLQYGLGQVRARRECTDGVGGSFQPHQGWNVRVRSISHP